MRRPIVWVPISSALLFLVIVRAQPWAVSPLVRAADTRLIAAAIALNIVVVSLWGLRSAALIRAASLPIGLGSATRLASMAYAVNSVTPGSTGEAVRAIVLREGHGIPYSVGLGAIMVERFGALWYLGASAAWAWLTVELSLPLGALLAGWAMVAALPMVWSWTSLTPGGLVRFVARAMSEPRREALRVGSRRLDDAIRLMLGRPGSALVFALTSAGLFGTFAAQLVLVAASVGVRLEPVAAWSAIGLAMVAGVLSLLPFGLGATDVVMTAGLVRAGLDPAVAAALTLAYRLVSTLPLGLLGAAAYWRTSSKH
jgi:uncharacterized protein (TIRG00374 family)